MGAPRGCGAVPARLLALLIVLAATAGAAAAARFPAAAATTHRRLAQCGLQCPDAAAATATCSALDQSQQDSIRNSLISSCSSVVLTASRGTCCDMLAALSPSDWSHQFMPCMCAGSGGLSAFVNPTEVLGACACTAGKGAANSSTSAAAPAPPLGRSAVSILSSVGVGTQPATTTASATATATATANSSGSQGGAGGTGNQLGGRR